LTWARSRSPAEKCTMSGNSSMSLAHCSKVGLQHRLPQVELQSCAYQPVLLGGHARTTPRLTLLVSDSASANESRQLPTCVPFPEPGPPSTKMTLCCWATDGAAAGSCIREMTSQSRDASKVNGPSRKQAQQQLACLLLSLQMPHLGDNWSRHLSCRCCCRQAHV
jgi:hypothetical protein